MTGILTRELLREGLSGAVLVLLIIIGAGCRDNNSHAVLSSGDITTWAGDGTQGDDGDGNDRLKSWLNQPMEMSFAPDGSPYIVDWNNHRIRRVKADGTLETVIGMSIPGDWPCSDATDPVNCPGKSLHLNHPMDLVFKSDGSFSLAAWHNHKVENYNAATGTVSIVAGQSSPGFAGDGGAASAAKMNFPDSIVMDSAGNLLFSDERSQRVRRISAADGTIKTVAGNSPSTAAATAGYSGDGVAATAALLAIAPYNEAGGSDNPPPGGGLALDTNGNLYLADTYNNCIRKVTPGTNDSIIGDGDPAEEVITTIAGSCGELNIGYNGDGGSALSATFNHPHDLDFGPDGRLYLADSGNHAVRAIDLMTGIVTTVAGTGTAGFSGDGGPATSAQLREPYGIAFDAAGNLYIVDTLNNRIRIVAK